MGVLALSPFDLALAGGLVLLLSLLAYRMRLGMAKQIIVADGEGAAARRNRLERIQ